MKNLPPLKFNNGKFKIMVVGDLHESYNEKGSENKLKSADMSKLLTKAVAELEPDLVVFMGDNARADDETKMRSVISRITYPVVSNDVPLAIVFGNHDRECDVPLEKQLEIYAQESDLFYTYDADPELPGCGNCNIMVKSSDGKRDVLNLWMVDSHSNAADRSISYYDWVKEEQIQWYKDTAQKIKEENNGETVPALWFMHIPVCEEYELLRKAKIYELPDSVRGHGSWSKNHYVLAEGVEGYLGEGPACADINSGVFDAWKETGDVMGAFFGHDHMNDFAGYYDGILLAQCKLAGFKPYTDGCRAGVRLVTLDENNISDIQTRMYHFKKFGLKSESLGFFEKNFTDRQIIKMKAAHWIIGGFAATLTAAKVAKKLKKKD